MPGSKLGTAQPSAAKLWLIPDYGYRNVPHTRKTTWEKYSFQYKSIYRGADKSLALATSRCILFGGKNISFDASLVIYTNSTNIPPIPPVPQPTASPQTAYGSQPMSQ